MTTHIQGELQIDHERGVIYFHASESEMKDGRCPTPLRICGLGQIEYPMKDRQVDVTIRPRATIKPRHAGVEMVYEVAVQK